MSERDKGFVVKDSGERQEFSTGARRDIQSGKGRFDLIPSEPIRRLARIYEAGAVKYGDDNWRKGMPLKRYLDSAERHINCLKAGEPSEDHAMQAVWNLFSYVSTLTEIEAGRLPRELDDRPPPEPQYRPSEEGFTEQELFAAKAFGVPPEKVRQASKELGEWNKRQGQAVYAVSPPRAVDDRSLCMQPGCGAAAMTIGGLCMVHASGVR